VPDKEVIMFRVLSYCAIILYSILGTLLQNGVKNWIDCTMMYSQI